MKCLLVLCFLLLLAWGCTGMRTKLLNEQKILKDSVNNINERIGDYLQRGVYDSAEIKKRQLGAVYVRLAAIQSSIDSLNKRK